MSGLRSCSWEVGDITFNLSLFSLRSHLLLPAPQGQASGALAPGQSSLSLPQESPSSGATASDTLGVASCQFFFFFNLFN